MGIRITAFAVDCGGFRDWLSRSVGDVLFYVAKNSPCEPPAFHTYEARAHEIITPINGRVVRLVFGGRDSREELTPEMAREIPVLRRELGDYLRESNPYSMEFLFYSMAACPGATWIRELTRGYKPYWIFSLLLGARDTSFPSPDLAELDRLCAKILRGFGKGDPAYPLKAYDSAPVPGTFPVLPVEDPDMQMGVLLPDEVSRWFELTDAVLALNPRFPLPREWKEPDNGEMDQLVRHLLNCMSAMRHMALGDPRLVTFIG